MRINLYNADTGELIEANIDPRDCFDDGPNTEWDAAREALEQSGEYFVGGGAAPAWHMKRASHERGENTPRHSIRLRAQGSLRSPL